MKLATQDINPASAPSQQIVGELFGKEARQRYANKCRKANFSYGASPDARVSTNSVQYDKESLMAGNSIDKQQLRQTIGNMRASHFDIGNNRSQSQLQTSSMGQNSHGFDDSYKPIKVDGNALRRENWGHGQRQPLYRSVNQSQFVAPSRTVDRDELKIQLQQVKQRVSGVSVSYKMGSQEPKDLAANFNTNTAIVHKTFEDIKPRDQVKAAEQRKKLSQSNFQMGKSPLFYSTTTDTNHQAKRGDYFSKNQRYIAAQCNSRTNFIDQTTGGYEKPATRPNFGKIPQKHEALGQVNVESLIADLKGTHFTMGQPKNAFSHVTNQIYGVGHAQTKPSERPSWAGQRTNFVLGSDKPITATDYASRFIKQGNSTTRDCDTRLNKNKMSRSAVQISGNTQFHNKVASHNQFQNVFQSSKSINSPLDPLVDENIRNAHWKTGNGPFGQPYSEQKNVFTQPGNHRGNKLPEDRIKFMKSSHFETGNPRMTMSTQPFSRQQFGPHDVSGGGAKYEGSTAYHLRNVKQELGDPKKAPNGFVTDAQIRIRWVQPKTQN